VARDAEIRKSGSTAAEPGRRERIVILVLPLGGVVLPIVGWLIGVVLLWSSPVWTKREKTLATLLPPGGLAVVVYLAVKLNSQCTSTGGVGRPTVQHCVGAGTSFLETLALATYLLTGIGTPVVLALRAFWTRQGGNAHLAQHLT
jgi:hypothetical protein